MFLQEYIMDIAILPSAIILLILSLGIFIDKVMKVKRYNGRKRLKSTWWLFILFLILTIIQLCIGISNFKIRYMSINDISPTIVTSALALISYKYNFIVDKGLFINGNIIFWENIKVWRFKEDSKDTVIIGYSKNNDSNLKYSTFMVKAGQAKEIEALLSLKRNDKGILEKESKISIKSIITFGICGLLAVVIIVNTYVKITPQNVEYFLEDILNDEYVTIDLINKSFDNNELDEYSMRVEEVQKQIIRNMNTLKLRKINFEVKPERFNKNTLELYFLDEDTNMKTIKVYEDLRTLCVSRGEDVQHYWVEGVNITMKFLLVNPEDNRTHPY